ncbi:hypothetical protein RKD47_001208 [Streptomyces albogriseolus]
MPLTPGPPGLFTREPCRGTARPVAGSSPVARERLTVSRICSPSGRA